MTKAQLLASLASQVVKVFDPVLVETIANVKTYDVPILRALSNGTWTKETQPIYVIDEGLPGEVATLARRSSTNEPVPADGPFLTALKTKIATLEVASGPGIKKIVIETLNEAKMFAVVTVYTLAAGTVTASKRFVVDENGTLNHYAFVG